MNFTETFARAKAGDEDAFLCLWESVRGIAVSCAVHHGRAFPDELPDFLQEMAIRLWLKLRLFDPSGEGSFSAWCHAVFRNLAIDLCRQRAAWRRRASRCFPIEPFRPPDEAMLRNEEAALVLELVARIRSPVHRQAVILRHLRDLTVAELAEETNVAENTAKVRAHRGRKEMFAAARRLGIERP